MYHACSNCRVLILSRPPAYLGCGEVYLPAVKYHYSLYIYELLHYITLVGRQKHSMCWSHFFLPVWTARRPAMDLGATPCAHPYGMRVRTLVGSLRFWKSHRRCLAIGSHFLPCVVVCYFLVFRWNWIRAHLPPCLVI